MTDITGWQDWTHCPKCKTQYRPGLRKPENEFEANDHATWGCPYCDNAGFEPGLEKVSEYWANGKWNDGSTWGRNV